MKKLKTSQEYADGISARVSPINELIKTALNEFAKQAVEYALEQAASNSIYAKEIDGVENGILSLKDQIFKDLNLNK